MTRGISGFTIVVVAMLLLLGNCTILNGQNIQLPRIFSDHMVLQREQHVPVWGKALPGSTVNVSIGKISTKTPVSVDGNWMIYLPPFQAGGPYELVVSAFDTIVFRDVMFGDVWFASGQSNMQFELQNSIGGEKESAEADYPNIRLFTVPQAVATTPAKDTNGGSWVRCTPETTKSFSAVAFYFGKEINKNQNIPIGLINSSWGGTCAEAWTSTKMMQSVSDFREKVIEVTEDPKEFQKRFDQYNYLNYKNDSILNNAAFGIRKGVHKPGYKETDWEEISTPNNWDSTPLKDYDGFVWFRKKVEVPKNHAGKELILSLGQIDLEATVWFNGIEIGKADDPRQTATFKIPGGLVKSGNNLIAVRIFDNWGPGGLWGPADSMFLARKNDSSGFIVTLAGKWLYNENIEPQLHVVPDFRSNLSVIYNAMVAPLIPYGIKGALWYQGENNWGRPFQYREILQALIIDWRINWKQGNFPFLVVQLPNIGPKKEMQANDYLPELRESQATALHLPETGMAVTIDLGEDGDIHPKRKKEVGERLALIALNKVYGEKIAFSGPVYDKMEISENKVIVYFSSATNGLRTVSGLPVTGFTIAGEDKKFYKAEAYIDGNRIVVSSHNVQNPKAVRYGWSDNPDCNLCSNEGLPAAPFRTDNWMLLTQKEVY